MRLRFFRCRLLVTILLLGFGFISSGQVVVQTIGGGPRYDDLYGKRLPCTPTDGDIEFDSPENTFLQAQFNYPVASALDNQGNLWIANSVLGNVDAVTEVDNTNNSETYQTSVYGSYEGDYEDLRSWANDIAGVAVDSAGCLYAVNPTTLWMIPNAATPNYEFSYQDYRMISVASYALGTPTAIAVANDAQTNIYVSFYSGLTGSIVQIPQPYSGTYNVLVNNFPFIPSGMAIRADGQLAVCDRYHHGIYIVSTCGPSTPILLSGGNGPGYSDGPGNVAMFNVPSGIAASTDGRMVVCDEYNNRVRIVYPDGHTSTLYGSPPSVWPTGECCTCTPPVFPGWLDGFAGNTATNAASLYPASVTISSNGTLYVTELGYNLLRSVTGSGLMPVPTPGVTTDPATAISGTNATLNATIVSDGFLATAFFEWGTTTNCENETDAVDISPNSCPTSFSLPVDDLPPNTVIYYQAAAYSTNGTVFGNVLSFQTPAIPPSVTTLSVNEESGSLVFNATVNPNNSPTTVYFEVGTSTTYGTNTVSVVLTTNLLSDCQVSIPFTNVPSPEIHSQAVAVNSAGTSHGGDVMQSFVGGSAPSGGPAIFNAITGAGSLVALSTNSGGCGSNNDVWISNPQATVVGTNISFTFTIEGGSSNVPYDVFANSVPAFGTNYGPNTAWQWMGQGYQCVTYELTNLPPNACFFVLGTPQDSYNNGLTDAYEWLVLRKNPAIQSGDGMLDGWKVLWGMNPNINNNAQTNERNNYSYDGTGRLKSLSGTNAEIFTFDAEGSITNDLP